MTGPWSDVLPPFCDEEENCAGYLAMLPLLRRQRILAFAEKWASEFPGWTENHVELTARIDAQTCLKGCRSERQLDKRRGEKIERVPVHTRDWYLFCFEKEVRSFRSQKQAAARKAAAQKRTAPKEKKP